MEDCSTQVHDAYFAKRDTTSESNNARAVNAVVVRNQDSHLLIINVSQIVFAE